MISVKKIHIVYLKMGRENRRMHDGGEGGRGNMLEREEV